MPLAIVPLAERPDCIDALARLHHAEWAELLPWWTLAEAVEELSDHSQRRTLPTTWIALMDQQLVGSASLILDDLPAWPVLTPWLSSLYVLAAWRGRGIGQALVERVLTEARSAAIPELYLCTSGQAAYYHRLGWRVYTQTTYYGHDLTLMSYQP